MEIKKECLDNSREICQGMNVENFAPYMPANGTEGSYFEALWCERCAKDYDCDIIIQSYSGKQRPEWIYFDNKPMCVEWEEKKMNHSFDKYDYLTMIGRYLGIKIESIRDLRSHLPQIPGFDNRSDLRKLDNLKIILDYLEEKSSKPKLQSADEKYQGLLGLHMEGGSRKSSYALSPYLVIYLQIKDRRLDGAWSTLSSKRLKFPISLKDLNQEFDSLIRSIEDPQYEDEIM